MKERFENYLRQTPGSENDQKVIERNVDPVSREKIDDIQMTKEQLVQSLRQWRGKFFGESVDDDLESQFGNRTLQQTENGFRTFLKGGIMVDLTAGEVFAVMEWGTFWKFDDDSVDKDTQQKIMTAQIRKIVADRYDDQLVAMGRVNKLSDERKRETYERISERGTQLTEMSDGILAEKNIMSFLQKAQIDYGLPFEIQSVDIYDDVENKIDFIVSVSDHYRGVQIDKQSSDIGVQFTLNPTKINEKKEQINASKKRSETDVDDIVLVSMPFTQIRDLFNQWRYNDDGSLVREKSLDPRGPDHLMNTQMKLEILQALFKQLPLEMTENEIRAHIEPTSAELRDAA